ncbi:hypothetical protein MtrunA17_Chr4g0020401 [Medicago truncatula]|uniref:Uncharacterized protein n=1 Tax=Medicago truncatula TaxID=3880 RepID=A0A396I5G0_MEDTR|nr:hypothetical protein MtrunA17_Chr4g0020401 [Medicago truncatula]
MVPHSFIIVQNLSKSSLSYPSHSNNRNYRHPLSIGVSSQQEVYNPPYHHVYRTHDVHPPKKLSPNLTRVVYLHPLP